jgi:CO dehydrogenase/acetyl-CoA synthase beta subunit
MIYLENTISGPVTELLCFTAVGFYRAEHRRADWLERSQGLAEGNWHPGVTAAGILGQVDSDMQHPNHTPAGNASSMLKIATPQLS